MTHSKEWQDTQQLEPRGEPAHDAATPAASVDNQTETPDGNDFAHTELQPRQDLDPRLWSEAADGQCSEDAAQFAVSQPAPLSIV
jgi:hypothetical protein